MKQRLYIQKRKKYPTGQWYTRSFCKICTDKAKYVFNQLDIPWRMKDRKMQIFARNEDYLIGILEMYEIGGRHE